jgi:hypothetical protein
MLAIRSFVALGGSFTAGGRRLRLEYVRTGTIVRIVAT